MPSTPKLAWATVFDHLANDDSTAGPFDVFDVGGYGFDHSIANIPFETPAAGLTGDSSIPGVIVEESSSSGSLPEGSSAGGGDSAFVVGSASSGLGINVSYDTSVSKAPAGFKTVVSQVVQFFQSHFNDPVTVNINVGYGEVGGSRLGAGALGESETNLIPVAYSQLTQALKADAKDNADSSAVASLPATDPTGGPYWVTTAQGKALGLLGASTSVDGCAGFSAPKHLRLKRSGVSAGQYDFLGLSCMSSRKSWAASCW